MLIYEKRSFPPQWREWLISWVTKPGGTETVRVTTSEKTNGRRALTGMVRHPSLNLAEPRWTGSSMRRSASIVTGKALMIVRPRVENINGPSQWIVKQSGSQDQCCEISDAFTIKVTEIIQLLENSSPPGLLDQQRSVLYLTQNRTAQEFIHDFVRIVQKHEYWHIVIIGRAVVIG